MSYDYRDALGNDIREYIRENIDKEEYTNDREGLEEFLNDELFDEDSVTGNASGSYAFSTNTAKEYVLDNTDILAEALEEFDCKDKAIDILCNDEWEYADVTIRCYLLGECIADTLDELEELGYFDSEEEED